MSMFWALERLFAPPEKIERYHRDQDAAVRHAVAAEDGDPPTFRCKLCGVEAAEPKFCMDCLAESMEPASE